MKPAHAVDTEVYASHRQFYLVDPEAETRADLVWDGHGLERHLGVSDAIVAVGTIGYCDVPVRLEIWDAVPPADLDDWDHVVDASLELRSGRLALGCVEGLAGLEPLAVEPGTYRLRSSAVGLDGADEMDGGDRYRIQLWPSPPAEPAVLRWWPPWDPATARARRTTAGGRVILGSESHDARLRMSWRASRGAAHLFSDDDGVLWEHSTLSDAAGTPQLEELDDVEAEQRYGPREGWGPRLPEAPSAGTMLRNIIQTLRYSKGWRPPSEPEEETLEDGRRVIRGGQAITRTYGLRWLGSNGGDNLHVDDAGALWEWRNEDAARGDSQLRELTQDEAREKYGTAG